MLSAARKLESSDAASEHLDVELTKLLQCGDPQVALVAAKIMADREAKASEQALKTAVVAHETGADVLDATPAEPEDAEALEAKLVRLVQSGG